MVPKQAKIPDKALFKPLQYMHCTDMYIQCTHMKKNEYLFYMLHIDINKHVYRFPLMQLVLGRAHEELKERNEAPSVAL